jgi:hypothetical protein
MSAVRLGADQESIHRLEHLAAIDLALTHGG